MVKIKNSLKLKSLLIFKFNKIFDNGDRAIYIRKNIKTPFTIIINKFGEEYFISLQCYLKEDCSWLHIGDDTVMNYCKDNNIILERKVR